MSLHPKCSTPQKVEETRKEEWVIKAGALGEIGYEQVCGDKKGKGVGNRGWAGGQITGMEGMDLEEEAEMMVNP